MNNNSRGQRMVQLAVSKPSIKVQRAKVRENKIISELPECSSSVYEKDTLKDVSATGTSELASYNNNYYCPDYVKLYQRNTTDTIIEDGSASVDLIKIDGLSNLQLVSSEKPVTEIYFDEVLTAELNKYDNNDILKATASKAENFLPVQLHENEIAKEPVITEIIALNSLESVNANETFTLESSETKVLDGSDDEDCEFGSVHSDGSQNDPSYEEGGDEDNNINSSDSEIEDEDVIPSKRRRLNIEEDAVIMNIEENDISYDAKDIVKSIFNDLMENIFRMIFKKATTVKLRIENKQKKDKGEEYVDRKGNVRCARKMKEKCRGCRFECKVLRDSDRENIFQEYWKIGDHHVQSQYITSLIEQKVVELGNKNRRKTKTNLFFLKTNNKKYRVCKLTFLATFGIGKRYVDILTKNTTQSGTSSSDMRGKKEPANKSSELDIQKIRNHILKFPSFESHYSRRDSKKQKYLHPDLNTRKMYSLYTEECGAENRKPLSYTTYYNIFKTMNLSFKKPYNDTCRVCDELRIKLKNKNLSEEDRKKFELEKQIHLEKVDAAYKTKANDKMIAKASEGRIVVKAFDLQKVLETPSLTTGTSFYKRQLSTYNLTTHDLATNQASSYLWYESIGGRGSDEVASILYKDIQNLSNEVEHLIYYSDNCTGQNHNFTLPLMYEFAIKFKPNLKTIQHKFLVVGHTHMECDSDHARIERAKPKDMEICIPRDWYTMIRMLKNRRGEPFFNVYEMKLQDFYDFKSLYNLKTSNYIKRQKFITNEPVEWSKTRWIKVDKEEPGIFNLSKHIDSPEFKQLSIVRNVNSLKEVELKIKNNTKIPISTKKYKNLLELLELIPEEYHQFYKGLSHSNKVSDTHADLHDFED